jgi:large subunit ribosomal protein L20
MPRSVNSVASRRRRKKVLLQARGYFGARSKVLSVAKNALDKAMAYAYVGRKQKKRLIRNLWIVRINAGVRQHGLSYSRFMHMLSQKGIELNRKVLADLALNDPQAFKAIVDMAQA